MASSQTDLLIKTVMNEATRLGDFLAGLDESAWSRDSACEGWVIGDVVGVERKSIRNAVTSAYSH